VLRTQAGFLKPAGSCRRVFATLSRDIEAGGRENGHGAFRNSQLPRSEEGHGVALVGLKSDGSLDSGRNFLFTHRPTREAQKSYAVALAGMLKFKVIELSE